MPQPLPSSPCFTRRTRPGPARVGPGAAGIAALVVCGLLLRPGTASAQGDNRTAAGDRDISPREIIDRLIAEPVDGEARGVDPRRGVVGVPSPAGDAPPPAGLDPNVVQVDPDTPLPRMRREGGFVVERPGRLIAVPDPTAPPRSPGELWVFAFDRVAGVDDLRPMIVQRTRRLQMMQDTRTPPSADPGDPTATGETEAARLRGRLIGRFLVSGQVHTFRGVNYLLLSSAIAQPDSATAALLEAGGRARGAPESGAAASGSRSPSRVTADTFDSPASATPATFGGSDDPIRQMEALLDRPAATARTPRDPNAGPVAEGINAGAGGDIPLNAAPRTEGTYLVERRGRVLNPDGAGPVVFAFSSDGAKADDPPVVLMPCGLLVDLQEQLERADVAPELVLSGRVYAYRGVNYVLPTSYRTVPRRDNLGN